MMSLIMGSTPGWGQQKSRPAGPPKLRRLEWPGTVTPGRHSSETGTAMAHDTFRLGDLTAIIGDNSAHGDHRAGYNGVWSLTHRAESDNLFVPTVAGVNFEHIFDGDKRDADGSRKVFFEPRHAPVTFNKLSDRKAELVQPPTPTFHLQSRTTFQLVAPHYIDMEFRCTATQHVFAHGYIG